MKPMFRYLFCLLSMLIIPISHSLAQGETCATAISINSIPYSYSGTTCGAGDDYSVDDSIDGSGNSTGNPNLCQYPGTTGGVGQNHFLGGEDLVFEFTPTITDCYFFTIPVGVGNHETSLHIFDVCPDDPAVVCEGFDFVVDDFFQFPVDWSVTMFAGETYYLVVSGSSGCAAAFDLNIEGTTVVNDICYNAIPIEGSGDNSDATNCGEPDDWAPNQLGLICSGDDWGSNENGVWYNFIVTAGTPQPVSITTENINCVGGEGNLQLGIWENSGDCTLSAATFVDCAVGINTVTVGPNNLPIGDYYLFVDGNGGANCTWDFAFNELNCDVGNPTPNTYGPYCPGEITGTLTATLDDPLNDLNWYDDDPENGGTLIGTGASISTPSYVMANTPGIYEVWVTEFVPGVMDCESPGQQIIIEIWENPTATLSGSGDVCAGSGDMVDLNLDLTGSTDPWTVIYAINGTNQPSVTYTSTPQIIQAGEGQTISLTSVTQNGCPGTASGSATIGTAAAPDAGEDNTLSSCNDTGVTLLDLNTLLSSGISGGNWTIDGPPIPAPGTFDENTGEFEVAGLQSGTYDFNYTVSGTAPCADDIASFTVTVSTCDCGDPAFLRD